MTAATFGATLRDARANAAISQAELARRADLSPGYISKIESGHRIPNAKAIAAIATGLGLTDPERAQMMEASGYGIDVHPLARALHIELTRLEQLDAPRCLRLQRAIRIVLERAKERTGVGG